MHAFSLSDRCPVTTNLLVTASVRVSLVDALNGQTQSDRSLEERRDNGSTGVESRHHPDPTLTRVLREEPEHGPDQVLMLLRHPQTIRGNNAGEGTPMCLRKSVVENTPFVRLHRDYPPVDCGDVARDVVVDGAGQGRRRWMVGDCNP